MAVLKPSRIDNPRKKGYFCSMKKILLSLCLLALCASCFQPERNCTDFRTGNFEFEAFLEGKLQKTVFTRNDSIEVDVFQGKSDTSSVRWLNDCEYILTNLNPKNRAEEKPLHIKIISTEKNTYTFEYGLVGEAKKQRGTAVKVK